MPYKIEKRGNKYAIVKKSTGEMVGMSDSMGKAQMSIAFRTKSEREMKKMATKMHGKK